MGHESLEEIQKPNLEITQFDQSFEDSFLDSLLNFEGWGANLSLTEVMNSEEKPSLEIMQQKEEKLGDLIQEEIGKVCITSSSDEKGNLEGVSNENEVKNDSGKGEAAVEGGSGGGLEDRESETESESSSSSSSDDDEEEDEEDDDESDEEELNKEAEMEEGEIGEDALCDDDDEDDIVKGPIRSMNEVQDLPPVPPVTVTIQPHHQTLPVGNVLSIMGSQVIVEGVADHNPLSEGSILWITECRTPLGVVDEIFGPVKNPFYIVRYNSETEIPTGIQQGSLISFVSEFADYVLNNSNLYKKGYDASGENDEECSEEVEFSDDEKEAEYKRMMKMSKRGSSGEKKGRMKNDKKSRNKGDGNWKNDHQPAGNSQVNGSSSGPTSGPTTVSQAPNSTPSGVWPYGFPSVQPQNIHLPPNMFPSNVAPFMQPNFIQQPFGFAPQFNTTPGLQMFPPNFVQGMPPNFGAFAPWPSGMPQNNSNQSQGGQQMVFQGFPQGVAMPNQGNGGRPPFQRGGGGCFRGGRSGPPSG